MVIKTEMTLGAIVTITNPEERQDKYVECLSCLLDLCDQVVVVDGGEKPQYFPFDKEMNSGKMKIVTLPWPYEWNWVELPRHLNAGKEQLTTEWCLKVDIDQFFHEKDFDQIRKKLAECPNECKIATFQKMSMAYGGKYYQKGEQPIAFRNLPVVVIGKNLDKETDLCFAVKQTGTERVCQTEQYSEWDRNGESLKQHTIIDYDLPIGKDLWSFKTGITYWNYDYFFKTKEFTKKEFWRFSRAYQRYFGTWKFGNSEEASFNIFLNMMKARYKEAPYTYKLEDHPKYIREAVKNLTPEMFGWDGWGMAE